VGADKVFLAVDLGTSAVKVVAVNLAGRVLTCTRQQYPTEFPRPGWVEQDPEEWWRAVCSALRQAVAAIPGCTVAGIGLSGQMKGLVVVDRAGRAVRRCIVYTDVRSKQEAEEIRTRYGDALHQRTGGWVRTPATVTKLVWMLRHEPKVYERTWRFLLPKDFVRLRLSGVVATDVTDAAGTLLYDVRERAWLVDLAGELGLNPEHFPRVLEPAAISGHVTPEASGATAVAAGTPVVAGAADMACTVLGAGALEPGDASITLSTAGQVLVVARQLTGPGGTIAGPHVLPSLSYLMGSVYAGGYSLSWILDVLNGEAPQDFSRVEPEVTAVQAGSGGLLFLPYLLGTGTPSFDVRTRGAFLGVSAEHGRSHLVRAVMEGVAFHLRQCVEVIEEWGQAVHVPVIGAGGSRSALWRQIVADVLGRRLRIPASPELAGLGAAILAAVGTGSFADIPAAARAMVHDEGVVTSQDSVRALYERQYRRFRLATDWLLHSQFDSMSGDSQH
jgi:xylulokinase